MSEEGQRDLDRALDGLERKTPARAARSVRWLRRPARRTVRIPLGVLQRKHREPHATIVQA